MKAVHNHVSKQQRELRQGDPVMVTLDNGTTETMTVESDGPWKLGGHTWVIGVANGTHRFPSYALSRVRPVKFSPR